MHRLRNMRGFVPGYFSNRSRREIRSCKSKQYGLREESGGKLPGTGDKRGVKNNVLNKNGPKGLFFNGGDGKIKFPNEISSFKFLIFKQFSMNQFLKFKIKILFKNYKIRN